ncbi:hypothetical protein BCR34DRAFT_585705 [Clohesyomyces aquaticus]|uniref:Uncharacterized protein n=1 Tax=Clohesyomyces aquaticus TaxID=1231657 RepID=A0A1Y1ZWB8_9PLEO|nr:hypothetical protein BCR34DRAFT_585705 [Clohesyomyces aquaticus]
MELVRGYWVVWSLWLVSVSGLPVNSYIFEPPPKILTSSRIPTPTSSTSSHIAFSLSHHTLVVSFPACLKKHATPIAIPIPQTQATKSQTPDPETPKDEVPSESR